ncbi:MAG: FMN-binding protein, partial [Clostridia bacterium]|nr:FMN-binding protein [Clostridia bacterium]
MKKTFALLLCAALMLGMTAAAAETLTGTADGFNGPVSVAVEVAGGKIIKVEVTEQNETPAVAGAALEAIPAAIVEKGDAQVDIVSGATYTSKAIIKAVEYALNPELAAADKAAAEQPAQPVVLEAAEAYIGFGLSSSGRIGPGKDDKEVPVYSFNQVFAQLVFDAEGKILFAKLDQLEVATPNYDGASMPHFSGFPGQSYNSDSDHDE